MRQATNGKLGCGVGTQHVKGDVAGNTGGVDDLANLVAIVLLAELSSSGLHPEQHGVDVNVEDLVQVGFRFVLEQLDLGDPSVVYVGVQAAKRVNGLLNEALVTFLLGCVAGN